MALVRRSSLNQLKRINDDIKKQKGITDRRSELEKGLPNTIWIDNPMDSDRKIVTYDDLYTVDIPEPKKSKIMEVKRFSQFEGKQINNLFPDDNKTTNKEMSVSLMGKYIETGDVKGYINRIEGSNVFIDSINDPTKTVKIPLKTALKKLDIKQEKEPDLDFSLSGPNNKSVSKPAKEDKNSIAPKIDGKSTQVDKKLSDKIYKTGNIKKFSDMSFDFDSKNISKSKIKVDKDVAPDQKITNKNTSIKKVNMDDLSKDFDSKKLSKNKIKVDKDVAPDQKITNKNSNVKKVSDMSNLSDDMDSKKISKSKINIKKEIAPDQKITNKNTKIKKMSEYFKNK